jgi:hypothetical protein
MIINEVISLKVIDEDTATKSLKRMPQGRPQARLCVLRDNAGWYYIRKLIELEGAITPFSSIEEIELFMGCKLEIAKHYVYEDGAMKLQA